MEKRTIGLYVGALVLGAAIYFVVKRSDAPPPEVKPAVPAIASGELQQLNEVKVQMVASPTSGVNEKPASTLVVVPMPGPAPPPLTIEYEPLLAASAVTKAFHEQFEHEPREEPWATLMEGKWNIAFTENPDLLAYGTPTAICRTTRCEIRLVSYKPSQLDRAGWVQLVIKGAGKRADGDQSVPLVRGIRNSTFSSIENNGATVLLYYYEYDRGPPAGP